MFIEYASTLCGPPNRNTKSNLLRPFNENLAGCVTTVSVKNLEMSDSPTQKTGMGFITTEN